MQGSEVYIFEKLKFCQYFAGAAGAPINFLTERRRRLKIDFAGDADAADKNT